MTGAGTSIRAEIIRHIDNIGVTLGSVAALNELAGARLVSSGSVMTPCPGSPTWRTRPAAANGLPVLLPADPAAYAAALERGWADVEVLVGPTDDVAGGGRVPVDRFLTVLTYQHRDSGTVYGRFMERRPVSFLPCSTTPPARCGRRIPAKPRGMSPGTSGYDGTSRLRGAVRLPRGRYPLEVERGTGRTG